MINLYIKQKKYKFNKYDIFQILFLRYKIHVLFTLDVQGEDLRLFLSLKNDTEYFLFDKMVSWF